MVERKDLKTRAESKHAVVTKDEGQGTILAFVDSWQIYSGKSAATAVEIKLFRDGLTVISATTASAVS